MNPTQAASPAIEAKSLSSLTALAANPPAYPRNPTHVKHDPLVLYIARVPGSKDVFLSPMKPRDKVVTAEDIQSSLYFIHVEQPEDAKFLDSRQWDSQPDQNSPISSPAVQRKALPGGQATSNVFATPLRKPVPGTLAPVTNFDSTQNAARGRTNMLTPDFNSRRSYDSQSNHQENRQPTAFSRRPSAIPQQYGTSLTLIRRDPASGAQWNVARIEDPPSMEVSSTIASETSQKRKPGAPMYIEVFNPGYSKFIHTEDIKRPTLMSHDSGFSVHSANPSISNSNYTQEPPGNNTSDVYDCSFRRRIWMEGSQHGGGGFGHRKNMSYDQSTRRPDSRGSAQGYSERSMMDGSSQPAPAFLSRDDQTYSTIHLSDRQTSFRGYVFTSPWNGRCEFVTGAGGGSLKCRHIVPGLQGAAPTAMSVSELRFNLPSSSKVTTPKVEEGPKRNSFFHRGRHSRNNSSISVSRDDTTEDIRSSLDRMDLSLGQEFAGGGFGGKQAKLGKIILEDEGLKMMDLLVAANLGLWWRAYERAKPAPQ